jgi:hypothetical protein
MKNVVFWDVAQCRSWWMQPLAHAASSLADFSTLKIEVVRSSETLVHTRSTGRHIPEDGILNTFPAQKISTEHTLALLIS